MDAVGLASNIVASVSSTVRLSNGIRPLYTAGCETGKFPVIHLVKTNWTALANQRGPLKLD
jgi:hypothetical protein